MRILFTFAGGQGHFRPLVPLARAALTAGHEVAFGGQPALLPAIGQAGFQGFDTGGVTFGDTARRSPLVATDMVREYAVVRDTYAGRIARARAAGILACAGVWRPDLLVRDEMDFGAAVAAERLDLPCATLLVIATGGLVRPEYLAEALNRRRAEQGLAPDPDLAMLSRFLVLAPFPPSLRDPDCPLPDTAYGIRPAFEAGAPPAWLADLPLGPIVYFTLGTVFNVESGDLFSRVLAGLAGLGATVIVTVGPQIDPQELGPQPSHVRVERFLDQGAVLPQCDLVVSHAGSGTIVGALAHGLPMLLLPMGADQPLNADRCAALGVARILDPLHATPAEIRDAASDLLGTPRYRAAASRLQQEIAALPAIETALPLLERLVQF
jgi:UDP:flavonoid glycosyltransferase YjiC (YdhE family)